MKHKFGAIFVIARVIVGEGILTNNQIQIDYVDGDVALLEKFQSLGSNQSVVLALDTTRYGKGDQHPYHIRNSRIFDKSAILQKPDETLENWINRVRNVSAAEYQKMLRDELAAKGETEWAARLEPRTFPPQRIQTGMLKSQPLQDNEVDKLQGELLPKSVSSSSITTTEASVQPQQNISSKSIEIGQQEKRSWSTSLLGVVLLVALITVVWRWKK